MCGTARTLVQPGVHSHTHEARNLARWLMSVPRPWPAVHGVLRLSFACSFLQVPTALLSLSRSWYYHGHGDAWDWVSCAQHER